MGKYRSHYAKCTTVLNALPREFHFLSKTKNLAAISCLESLLDSRNATIRFQAAMALVQRTEKQAYDRLIQAFARHPVFEASQWPTIKHRLLPRLLEILEDSRDSLFRAALRLVSHCHVAEGFSTLVHAAEQTCGAQGTMAGKMLVELALQLGAEARAGRIVPVREPLIQLLGQSVVDFAIHRNTQIVEAFLVGATIDDSILQSFLSEPDDKPLKILIRQWKSTQRIEALDLLVGLFTKHYVPPTVADIVLRDRTDPKMAMALARGTANGISASVAHRIQQSGMPACCPEATNQETELQDAERWQLWKLMAVGNLPLPKLFEGISSILTHNSVEAQQVVADILRQYGPPEYRRVLHAMAPRLAWDENVIAQSKLDGSEHDGALFRQQVRTLLSFRESGIPNLVNAIGEFFREFSIAQFLAHVDILIEDALECFAEIVPLADPQWHQSLLIRLESPQPKDRCQAAIAAGYLQPHPALKIPLTKLKTDKYEMIQEEAIFALKKYEAIPLPSVGAPTGYASNQAEEMVAS